MIVIIFYPNPIDLLTTGSHGIIVGGMNPNGSIYGYSSQGPNVDIAAPAQATDPVLNGFTGKGTSFAAPLVTGSLMNAAAFIPQLTEDQARKLLVKTALPTVNSLESPQLDGAGTVNAYKLMRVAERIRNAPNGLHSVDALLDTPATYDFESEATQLLKDGEQLLASTDCSQEKKGFDEVRTSYLLNFSEESRQLLEDEYTLIKENNAADFMMMLKPGNSIGPVRE
jgi:hypothetical protein